MQDKLSVVLVDDHVSSSTSVAKRLKLEGYTIVATLDHAGISVAVCDQYHPDIVLMETNMPGADPFMACEEILTMTPDTKVIFFTGFSTDHYIDRAIECNASGFISKTEKFEHLVWAMEHVMRGKKYYSPRVAQRLIQTRGKPPISRFASLTTREKEVLYLLAQGSNCRDVGAKLNLSPKTVEKHQYRIREKLLVNNAVELTRYAIREGLLEA